MCVMQIRIHLFFVDDPSMAIMSYSEQSSSDINVTAPAMDNLTIGLPSPMMYSRHSSLQSLDSFDQHSI